ncbi:MAG: class I SAM-dependent methyltransferase [Pseudomonadaceae bacterium]|nr:class I SAM-dependent methyltransferase [Pseudomonadaceae bacterium]
MIDPHYSDARLAALYDLDSPWSEDTDFYIDLIGGEPRRVLDIGCGTGTLCVGLAQRGHDCTGLDPAAAMLDIARSKPGADRVRWVCATAQNLDLAERFDWIVMTGHAFQTLVSDQEIHLALRAMHRHLAANGCIAFETRNPVIDWDKHWRRESTWITDSGPVRQVRSGVAWESGTARFHHDFHFADARLRSESVLRFLSEAELRRHLSRADFAVKALVGDWQGADFEPQRSLEMIVVAQPAK